MLIVTSKCYCNQDFPQVPERSPACHCNVQAEITCDVVTGGMVYEGCEAAAMLAGAAAGAAAEASGCSVGMARCVAPL
jgi:hypothetical protein